MIKNLKYSELIDRFGQPGDVSHMVKIRFPFSLYLGGDRSVQCNNFYGHKYIANSVIDAFTEIMDIFGIEFIRKHGLDEYGGCFNNRLSRGSTRPSVHAWGLAIDYLPHLGQLGEPPLTPFHVVNAFTKRGFLWGGNWSRSDGMHFSSVIE